MGKYFPISVKTISQFVELQIHSSDYIQLNILIIQIFQYLAYILHAICIVVKRNSFVAFSNARASFPGRLPNVNRAKRTV
jgi:hypothetical protein